MTQSVTLVTGASRGIGLAVARDLTRAGQRVVGLARRRPDGFEGEFITADLADARATTEAIAEATRRFEVLRLVNNAGIAGVASIEAATPADFDRMVAVNLRAVLAAIQAVVPGMRQAGFGRIVTIGSRAALGKSGRAIYSATKAAVMGLTRTAALELATAGITVNCVAPGPVETDMIRQNYPAGSERRAALTGEVPMRRFGQPEEIAAAVRYFLSEEAGFTTGQTLFVCGGLSVGLAPG